MELIVML